MVRKDLTFRCNVSHMLIFTVLCNRIFVLFSDGESVSSAELFIVRTPFFVLFELLWYLGLESNRLEVSIS